ncbi:hypothetical protein P5663_06920 [Priestia flexa]|uniref:hypothetical protein n=1 Tax=Priestia flexa TaxID=86664 RepID=UPI00240DF693|nr:hypothetical protein [Priestia flexa]WEZ09570.1 hypothetical protein P5663_06920 [Priestia flexa]
MCHEIPSARVKDKLLVIELDNVNDVPTVYYKGKEVKGKMRVDFTWISKSPSNKLFESPYINIEHMVTGEDYHIERIGYNERIIPKPTDDYNIEPIVINDETKYKVTIKDNKNESLLVRLKKLMGIG